MSIDDMLRDARESVRLNEREMRQLLTDMAEAIVQLRTELYRRMHPGQGEGYALEEDRLREVVSTLRAALADRDALITNARDEVRGLMDSLDDHVLPDPDMRSALYSALHDVFDSLSRAPQGAKYEDHACSLCGDIHEREPADRRGEAGDGPPTTDDPVPLGSDRDHNSTDCYLGNHEKCKACGCDCHAATHRQETDRG